MERQKKNARRAPMRADDSTNQLRQTRGIHNHSGEASGLDNRAERIRLWLYKIPPGFLKNLRHGAWAGVGWRMGGQQKI